MQGMRSAYNRTYIEREGEADMARTSLLKAARQPASPKQKVENLLVVS
jgi:hypothetical protein